MEKNTERKLKTNILSIIPLRGKVAFPDVMTPFEVGRDITVKAIERASAVSDRIVFVLAQRDTDQDEITAGDLYTVGTVAKIKQVTQLPGGTLRVLVEGLYRARAREIVLDDSGYYYAVTEELKTVRKDAVLEEAYFRTAREIMKDVLSADGKISKEAVSRLDGCLDAEAYIHIAASNMRIRLEIKQSLLEEDSLIDRLKLFERCLNDELEIAKIERKISASVRKNIDRSQKEYFLREQLKAIHDELGDGEKENTEYRNKILNKNLPEDIEKKCLKELDRLDKMPSTSPEYTVITGYLDWIVDLPWTEQTTDTEKLSDLVEVLENDHYGLEKIKERITEYLAVLKLKGDMKAPILCLVGPPGVGKTSIARSIARALGRKFVRMSLGGVKDEAEIRGHRRTYVGAMPGRILYSMKNAGSVNPVFLLDEVDKISSDMRGDPASALLEVLDPEQNNSFRDRYLEVPYDLSKVLFIATANTLETIPAPLRDRMEILELSGYTLEEKTEIAKRYLVPKQLNENGISEKQAAFTDEGLRAVIEGYTREAGVRTLERTIGTIIRKIAVQYADNRSLKKIRVGKAKAEELLGAPRYTLDSLKEKREVGAATGLAWTAVGGTTLTVEASIMKGKGEIRLTGQLGDVMKESAFAALSYIRSNADRYGITGEKFEENNVHIHVPEGATPKDGPSAGITIATALLSVFTGRRVKRDVAMTGEITLRGRVLPIGGLKEKALAARRIGIKNIVIPAENQKDLEELPESIREELHFIPVSAVDEVFAVALEETETKKEHAKDGGKRKLPVVPKLENNAPSVRC